MQGVKMQDMYAGTHTFCFAENVAPKIAIILKTTLA